MRYPDLLTIAWYEYSLHPHNTSNIKYTGTMVMNIYIIPLLLNHHSEAFLAKDGMEVVAIA